MATVALLGILGAARGLPGAATLLTGGTIDRPAAVVAQAMTAVLCAVLIALYTATLVAALRPLREVR